MAVTFPFIAGISPSFDPCFPSLFLRVVSRGTSYPQREHSLVGRVGEAPRCGAGLCRLERKPGSGGEGLKGSPGLPKLQSSQVQAPRPRPDCQNRRLSWVPVGLLRVDTYYYVRCGHADRQTDTQQQTEKDKIKMMHGWRSLAQVGMRER